MNSPFANIFLHLQLRLAAIYIDPDAETPESVFKYIDMDYGQLESKERPTVAFPCILIDFQNWTFKDMGELAQTGEGGIIIKVAADPFSSSSNITPDEYKQAALDFLDLEWLVYCQLQGWRPNVSDDRLAGTMGRTGAISDNRRPGIKVKVLTFESSIEDYSAERKHNTAPATISLTVSKQ